MFGCLITLQSSSYVGTGAGLTKIMKAASADLYWFVFNPVHPYIRMHIFYTTLNKSPMVMTRRICFKIKSFSSLWSFSVFSYPRCFKGDTERRYYMLVTIEVKGSHIALRAFCLVFILCLFFWGGVFSLFLFGCAWDSFGFKALCHVVFCVFFDLVFVLKT